MSPTGAVLLEARALRCHSPITMMSPWPLYILLSPSSLRSMSVVRHFIWRTEVLRHSLSVARLLLRLVLSLFIWGFVALLTVILFCVVEARSISLSHLQGSLFQFSASYDDALADIHSYNKSWERPDLHVLVDARVRDLGLCRTLLSTVVQGYPAPILVGYHDEPLHGDTLDLLRSIIKSIVKPPTAEGDIILWLGRHHWVQLPVEVTVRRFLQHADVIASTAQRRRHGKSRGARDVRDLGGGNDTGLGIILLPASKACIYDCQNADILLESTLPNDLYGPLTDKVPCPGLRRPRFAGPGAFIGTARDVLDSLTGIIDHMAANTSSQLDEESAWSHLLRQQELHRSIEQQDTSAGGWMYRALGALSRNHAVTKSQSREDNNVSSTRSRALDEPNHARGLTLDYASRIFQTLLHSDQDIRFLTFSQPHLVRSPSRTAASFFATPLRLPPELEHASLPMPRGNTSWRSAPLATNIAVPRSSVPAVLDLSGTPHLRDPWWRRMWFYPYARELVEKYSRPDRAEIARQAEDGGGEWWNLRGGGGGFWTDRGAWVGWEQVCGGREFERGLFGDDAG